MVHLQSCCSKICFIFVWLHKHCFDLELWIISNCHSYDYDIAHDVTVLLRTIPYTFVFTWQVPEEHVKLWKLFNEYTYHNYFCMVYLSRKYLKIKNFSWWWIKCQSKKVTRRHWTKHRCHSVNFLSIKMTQNYESEAHVALSSKNKKVGLHNGYF